MPHFVILTRTPSDDIGFIHDRMPLMMPRGSVDEWIRPSTNPEEMLGEAVTDIYYERVESQGDTQLSLF